MAITNKPQSVFEDDLSLSEIIQLIKANRKILLSFILLGSILGGIYGKFTNPIYIGSITLAPAKIAGKFIEEPGTIVTKLNHNSYYTKDTLLTCESSHNKDKAINFRMSDIINTSLLKNSTLIKLSVTTKNQETIENCLNAIESDLKLNERRIIEDFVQSRKELLVMIQNQIKDSEEFKRKINDTETKNLKTNIESNLTLTFAKNANFYDLKVLIEQLEKIEMELSIYQTNYSSKIFPINIEQKDFPSTKFGILLGFFLGAFLGLFVIFIRRMVLDSNSNKNNL